ncbi:IS1-like element transposase [Providencia rettgeri]|nr:hypothetical protein [Providencia rettgeri]ELR5245697.1 hypothetical protein [Providencia rettgeri]
MAINNESICDTERALHIRVNAVIRTVKNSIICR